MTTSAISRRQRYQSQLSNAASSLGQSFSNSELNTLNDAYASSFPSLTPWVHIVYSTSAAVMTKGTIDDDDVLSDEEVKQQVCEQ